MEEGAEDDPVDDDPRRWPRRALVASAFAALVAFVHQPWRMVDSLPKDGADSAFVSWTLLWGAEATSRFELSRSAVFNAPIFWPNGNTLAYSDPFLPFGLPFGVLHALTDRWTTSAGLFVVALVALDLGATYALARRMTGRTDAAVLAAVAMACSDFALAQWGHIQVQTMGLLPLALLLLFKLLERPRWYLVAGLAVVQVVMATTAASVALAWAVAGPAALAVALVLRPLRPRLRTLGALAVAMVATAVVVLPASTPYLDLQDQGFRRPPEDVFAMELTDLLTPTRESRLAADLTLPATGRGGPEREMFPGALVLVLAVVGLVTLVPRLGRRVAGAGDDDVDADRRRAELVALVAAGVACLLIALGNDVADARSPYTLLHEHVPGFAGLRAASRFAMVTVLAIAVAAAAGLTALLRRLPPGRWRVAVAAVALGVTVVELAIPVTWTELGDDPDTLAVYRALDDLEEGEEGPVVELPIVDFADGVTWARVEATRMLFATTDWQPRFNGYSGFVPPAYPADARVLNRFPDACSVDRLRALDIRWVVLHGGGVDRDASLAPAALRAALAGLPDGAAERHGRSWLVDAHRLPAPAPGACKS